MREWTLPQDATGEECVQTDGDTGPLRAALALSNAVPQIGSRKRNSEKTEARSSERQIKMTAYQVETELFRMLGDHYARTEDEGRTLLHAVFQLLPGIDRMVK